MNIQLFSDQLNQMLASTEEKIWLKEACALLHMHTQGGVKAGDIDVLPLSEGEYDLMYQDIYVYGMKKPPNEDIRLAASIIAGLYIITERHRAEKDAAALKQNQNMIKGVINSLSFSELEAAAEICRTLSTDEGLLVAGHIADKLGFTRSVVVNALRKLESAGVAETRSLGMKGTFIKIINPLLITELRRL